MPRMGLVKRLRLTIYRPYLLVVGLRTSEPFRYSSTKDRLGTANCTDSEVILIAN